jgi:hypothetical protein
MNPTERIAAAYFPGADAVHSNTFNGFPVMHRDEPSATLTTGQALNI